VSLLAVEFLGHQVATSSPTIGPTSDPTVGCKQWPKAPATAFHRVEDLPAETYDEGRPIVLANKVSATTAGTITTFRFYKTAKENGVTHTGKLYSWPQRELLAQTKPFVSCKGPGWVSAPFNKGVAVGPSQQYLLVLDGVRDYAKTQHFFTGPKTNGALVGHGGLYGFVVGEVPVQDDQLTTNYFIDCKFRLSNHSLVADEAKT
jgi:hypothetical protein